MISGGVDAALAMQAAVPLPAPDPLGFPLYPVILLIVAQLTLTLHFLAMNFTVGAAALFLWARWRKVEGYDGIARFLGSGLPLGVSYIITFGIPPLLIVQVLYGQMFYSSSVLVGTFWIHIIPMLIAAYGGFYAHRLTRDSYPRFQGLLVGVCLVMLLMVGFVLVNNLTLSMQPAKWLALYQAHPNGTALNLDEPTLIPRYILFIIPSLTVVGVALILRGAFLIRWGRRVEGLASKKLGYRSFVLGLIHTGVAGFAVFTRLPERISEQVLAGGGITIHLVLGLVFALLAGVAVLLSIRRDGLTFPLLSAGAVALGLLNFVVMRDLVRQEYLRPYFRLSDVPVRAQWGAFAVFVVALLTGLILLAVLLVKVVPNLGADRGASRTPGYSTS